MLVAGCSEPVAVHLKAYNSTGVAELTENFRKTLHRVGCGAVNSGVGIPAHMLLIEPCSLNNAGKCVHVAADKYRHFVSEGYYKSLGHIKRPCVIAGHIVDV